MASNALQVGEIVRRLRKDGGLTQRDLANRLGLSTNYINLVESGRRRLSVDQVQAFAELLDVPPSFIYLLADSRLTGSKHARELLKSLQAAVSAAMRTRSRLYRQQ
jgi:transcriptional regulator with XRE-family HTH domain